MSICKLNLTRLLMLGILLLFSTGAFALGLGNANAESYLGQPLNVRIDMLTREGEDLSVVTAKLASAEDYALIGANRDAISVPLRFNLDVQGAQPFIRVTSNLPVNDPVVRLIVELNWASGRLLREYTLFLDPPTVSSAAPPPVIDERTKPVVQQAPAPAPTPAPVPIDEPPAAQDVDDPADVTEDAGRIQSSSEASSDASGEFTGDDEYGPVQSGDTLWRIASNWSEGSGASINQVMVAIQSNNPQAFINNNINLLKRGAILRMPSSADIAAISAAEANSQVRAQNAQFAGGTPAPTPAEPSPTTAVETPLVDVASDMSGADNESSYVDDSPQLEIVPPGEDSVADSAYGEEESTESGSASTSVVDLQEELARKEEALITEQQTNEYLQERIKELESQIAAGDASLTVEDEELAGMESRLREQRINEAEAEEAPASSTQIPQVTTTTGDEAQPWYSHWVTWLIAVLVLVAAGFGWYRSKLANEAVEFDLGAANEDAVKGMKDEAEEILKVLDPKAGTEGDDKGDDELELAPGTGDEPAGETQAGPTDKQAGRGKARRDDAEEASVLDEDSADPEVRLDLARAYISMGDREAARAILGEVIEHGDDAQQAEAKSMLDEM